MIDDFPSSAVTSLGRTGMKPEQSASLFLKWIFLILFISGLILITAGQGWAQEKSASEENPAGQSEEEKKTEKTAPPKSRAEEWRQKRLEKQQEVQTPKTPFYEKFLYSFDQKGNQTIEDLNFWGFHPRLDWIARGSGAALGVRYWKPNLMGPTSLMGAAFVSWRNYHLYNVQYGLIPNKGKRIPSMSFMTDEIYKLGSVEREQFSRFSLYASAQYRYNSQEQFYGIGIDSTQDDLSTYLFKENMVGVTAGYQFTANMSFSMQLNYRDQSLGQGKKGDLPQVDEIFDEESAPGITSQPDYFQFRSIYLMDFRDDYGHPHKGWYLALGFEKNQDLDLQNYSFYRWGADLRGLIPLGSFQRVLALRMTVMNADPAENSRVPFYLQANLGGGETLRGYPAFRFVGEKMGLIQAEYRWEPARWLQLALFTDGGQVAPVHTRMGFSDFRWDWGIGIRLLSTRFTVFRIDQAWGDEGPVTNFRFAAVF